MKLGNNTFLDTPIVKDNVLIGIMSYVKGKVVIFTGGKMIDEDENIPENLLNDDNCLTQLIAFFVYELDYGSRELVYEDKLKEKIRELKGDASVKNIKELISYYNSLYLDS